MKNSSRHLLIILSILILAFAAANYVFFHIIRSSGVEVSNLQQEITSLQAQVQEFQKYRPEDLKLLAASVTAKIIPHGDFVDFIESIESNARNLGVTVEVQSVNVVPRNSEDDKDNMQILHVRLVTNGSWTQTMYFLNYLEHLPYKIAITNMGLSKGTLLPDGKGTSDTWRGTFEITALKFK